MSKWAPVAALIFVSMGFKIGNSDRDRITQTCAAFTCGNNEAPPRPIGTKRIGSIEVSRDIAFQVTASMTTIYFVYNQGGSLYLCQSDDGGTHWTLPELASHVATNKKFSLAIDSRDELHLVYSTRDGSASWYRSHARGRWNSPVLLHDLADFQDTAPAVAVDGNDNVHVLLWSFATDWKNKNMDWKASSRLVYRRRLADQLSFDDPDSWKAGLGELGAGNGTIEVSSEGDVHFIYVGLSRSNGNNAVERRIRRKNGSWDLRHDIFENIYVGDHGISGAVGSDDILHLAIFEAAETPKGVGYFKSTQPNALRKIWQEYEYWEANTDIFIAPNGDLWMTSANHPWGDLHDPEEHRASFWHRDNLKDTWSDRIHVSSSDYINVDHTHFGQPKLIFYNGSVLMYYAEKEPGSNFVFYQRTVN